MNEGSKGARLFYPCMGEDRDCAWEATLFAIVSVAQALKLYGTQGHPLVRFPGPSPLSGKEFFFWQPGRNHRVPDFLGCSKLLQWLQGSISLGKGKDQGGDDYSRMPCSRVSRERFHGHDGSLNHVPRYQRSSRPFSLGHPGESWRCNMKLS